MHIASRMMMNTKEAVANGVIQKENKYTHVGKEVVTCHEIAYRHDEFYINLKINVTGDCVELESFYYADRHGGFNVKNEYVNNQKYADVKAVIYAFNERHLKKKQDKIVFFKKREMNL